MDINKTRELTSSSSSSLYRVIQISNERNDDGREIFTYMQTFAQYDFL